MSISSGHSTNVDSLLYLLVKDALTIWPEEAAQKLAEFITHAGTDETGVRKFKQAWSTLVLADQSFGRGKSSALDPRRFATELDAHLKKGSPEHAMLVNLSAALDRESQQMIGAASGSHRGCLTSLQRLSTICDNLSNSSQSLETYFESKDELSETEFMERLYDFKGFIRGGKCTWHHATEKHIGQFAPVNIAVLGGEVVFGTFKSKSQNPQFAACSAIGFKVSHRKPVQQKLAWGTFQVMTELATYTSSLFPFPLYAHMDNTRAAVFGFENPKCTPMRNFLSAALSVNLMKYPRVLLTWCRQFYAAICVLRLRGGKIIAPQPKLASTFVREGGTLLLGDQLFEPSEDMQVYQADQRTIDLLVRYFVEFVATVLSLSRVAHTDLASTDETKEETLYIVQGGTLRLHVSGIQVDHFDIETVAEDISRSRRVDIDAIQEKIEKELLSDGSEERKEKIASVKVHGNPRAVDVSDLSSNGTGILDIRTRATGAITLKIRPSVRQSSVLRPDISTVSGEDDEYSASDLRMQRDKTIHVSVLPPPVSTSLELQELIHLIHSAFSFDKVDFLLQAQALRQNIREDEISLLHDWNAIKLSIRN